MFTIFVCFALIKLNNNPKHVQEKFTSEMRDCMLAQLKQDKDLESTKKTFDSKCAKELGDYITYNALMEISGKFDPVMPIVNEVYKFFKIDSEEKPCFDMINLGRLQNIFLNYSKQVHVE